MRAFLVGSIALLAAGLGHAAEQAGVSAAVRGTVELTREQVVGRQVEGGEDIFLRDFLRSGVRSGMQILLLDETVFTVGPESELIVDEFVYDPASGAGELTAEITKGLFRFVTGKVADQNPNAVNLKLPAGNIGIRGTVLAGEVRSDLTASVFLLAEGPRNDLQARPGAFEASNEGVSVEVRTPGWGVELAPGQPPELRRFDPGRIAEVTAKLADPTGQGAGGRGGTLRADGRRVAVQSGAAQGAALAWGGFASREVDRLESESDDLTDFTETALLQAQLVDSTFGLASVADLVAIGSGLAGYNGTANLSDGGDYSFAFLLDFGTRQVRADVMAINSPSLAIFGDNFMGVLPFSAGQRGEAVFQFNGTVNNMVGTPQDIIVDAAFVRDGAGTPPTAPGSLNHGVTLIENPISGNQVVTGGASTPRSFP